MTSRWKNKQLLFCEGIIGIRYRFYASRWLLTVFSQIWGLQPLNVHGAPSHSGEQLCLRTFGFISQKGLQESKRKRKNGGKGGWKAAGKDARVTPSHPIVSLLVGPSLPLDSPFWVNSCFFCLALRLWNLSQVTLHTRDERRGKEET